MDQFLLSIFLVIGAGVSHATFGLGQKYFKPLAWEAFWLPFSFISMLVIAPLWASFGVPDVWEAMTSIPAKIFFWSAFFGACWGVGAIFWARSLIWIGLALTYGICLSIAMAMGSLVPMVQREGVVQSPAFPFIILGTVVMLLGVFLITFAGIRRDRIQLTEGKEIRGITPGRLFKLGLVLAVFAGVSAALENIGYDHALPAAAAAEAQGASKINASLVPWIIVFIGGFLVQGGYSLYLLIKNKTYTTYITNKAWLPWVKIIITSFFWFAALAFYGQGAALMGRLGTSIGWTMFLSLSLIISNIYAYLFGEWKGAERPLSVMLLGTAVLLISWTILGYANNLTFGT